MSVSEVPVIRVIPYSEYPAYNWALQYVAFAGRAHAGNFFPKVIECLADGSGVDVYLLSTGVNSSHSQFDSSGSAPKVRVLSESDDADFHGEGTHLASLIVGRQFGFAPGARLWSIPVGDSRFDVSDERILAALKKVRGHVGYGGSKAVLLLAARPGRNSDLIALELEELNRLGVVCVVPAADWQSPSFCVRVGAHDESGHPTVEMSTDSLMGEMQAAAAWADLLAPGRRVIGASHLVLDGYDFRSGASVASAWVTGVICCWLQKSVGTESLPTQSMLSAISVLEAERTRIPRLYFPYQDPAPRWNPWKFFLGCVSPGDECQHHLFSWAHLGGETRYSLHEGRLPTGLQLRPDGRIQGRVEENVAAGHEARILFSVRAEARGSAAIQYFQIIVADPESRARLLLSDLHYPDRMWWSSWR